MNKNIVKTVIGIVCLVVIGFGMLVYFLLPALSDFRNSIYGLIISCTVVAGIILYLILSKRINQPLLGKITTASYGVLYILLCIIDLGKVEALFFLIYSAVNIAITIYIYKKNLKEYKSIWIFGALAYLSTVLFVLRVKYITGEFNLTFLIPSIIIAAIVFLPCLIFGIKSHKSRRSLEKLICIPLLGLFGGFIIPWLTISSMNVYLDFSEPTYVEYVIIDKDVRTGARKVTTYELEVQNESGSFTIGVSEEAYYDYDINDTIILSIYNGAFNEPYYIHEDK